MVVSALRKLLRLKTVAPIRRITTRLRLETLEDRWCPSTLTVGSGKQYATIGAALAAASPNGAEIDVYPGTYAEQLTISKTNINLVAKPSNGLDVVIAAPATMSSVTVGSTNIGGALLDITATKATVNGFKIDGTSTDTDLWMSVRVRNGGSATITNNTILGAINPCDPTSGIAVQVGTSRVTGTAGAGTAKVTGNTISSYLGAGVLVDGSGASATIKSNTITGRGAGNSGVAEYGVQVSQLATARVESNTISNNTLSGGGDPQNDNSAGILVFQDSGKSTVVTKNTVRGNDYGIWVQASSGSCSGEVEVVNNDVTGNVGFAGIFVKLSSQVEVENNAVFNNNTFNGIALSSASNVEVENNDVLNNASDGIYDFQGTNNLIQNNDSFGNGGNGVFLDHSTNDQVWNNSTHGSALSGIYVLGGSSNDIWLGDSVGNVQDGITLQDTTANTVVLNYLSDNGGYGLQLLNADNTLIAFNTLCGNDAGSIKIDAASTGTVSIGNRTDTPPQREGTSGAGGCSVAYTCAWSDADNLTADL